MVKNTDPVRTLDLKLRVSKTAQPLSDDEWEDRAFPISARIAQGFYVKFRDLPQDIKNRRFIRIAAVRPATGAIEADSALYYLRYIKRWTWWNGLKSPVLYRFVGNAAEFGLSNFAPSLAGGPQSSFGGGDNQFVALDGLLTVFQSTEKTDKPFSLAAGAVLDFGGWVQTGWNYHFKDKKGYFVLGVRPEIWKPGN